MNKSKQFEIFHIQAKFKFVDPPKPPKKKGLLSTILSTKADDLPPASIESDSKIDSRQLAADIEKCLNQLHGAGLTLISITPVISGDHYHDHRIESGGRDNKGYGGFGFGYGFSYTEAVIITAQRQVSMSEPTLD